jgi:hypothetical protein
LKNGRNGWTFQELGFCWTLWAFGVTTVNNRGWEMDERIIYFGPFQFFFVSSKQMDRTEIPADKALEIFKGTKYEQ